MSIQTQNLRTVIWPLLNPDTGLMTCDTFSWLRLENEKNSYNFDEIVAAAERAKRIKRCMLLSIRPEKPDWCENPMENFLQLIHMLGQVFGCDRSILGVDVLSPMAENELLPEELTAIAEAYCHAFPYAIKFVREGSAFERIMEEWPKVGVIVTPDVLCRYEDKWQTRPLRMAVNPDNAAAVQTAIDGHVSLLEADAPRANAASHAGHRFQVRTVQIDESRRVEGFLDSSVTIANVGSLPCYADACFYLRLSGSDVLDVCAYPLPLKAAEVKPGDRITVNCALDVTDLKPGEYDVQVGLFLEECGYPISFGIEGRISDGYYEGRLIVRL